MIDIRRSALFIVCLIAACLLGTGQAFAVGRTTPVEVMNTPMVGIDPNNSTVKAAQIDPWLVEVIGTPSFIISNSPTVKIDGTANTVKATQSGTWSVGVSSMPTVNVNTHPVSQSGTWNVGISGTPTVAIDGSANTVHTVTSSYTMAPFVSNVVLANGSSFMAPVINCAGFKEIRGVMRASVTSGALKVDCYFSPTGVSGSYRWVGTFDFATASESVGTGANFYAAGNRSIFTMPTMSNYLQLVIVNVTGQEVTVYNDSWVHLVN